MTALEDNREAVAMPTRLFHKALEVNNEVRSTLFVRAQVADLADPTPWPAKGPRGGSYIADGPITMSASDQVDDAFMRNVTVYRASRTGRYVRPRRK